MKDDKPTSERKPMRKEFKLTDKQLKQLLSASRPMPVMFASGGRSLFGSQQENADSAWARLGKELGFVWNTVRPVMGRGQEYFTAEVDGKDHDRQADDE